VCGQFDQLRRIVHFSNVQSRDVQPEDLPWMRASLDRWIDHLTSVTSQLQSLASSSDALKTQLTAEQQSVTKLLEENRRAAGPGVTSGVMAPDMPGGRIIALPNMGMQPTRRLRS
jgi:hypothetical protein